MYEKFYGLKEKPFNMTPDPKFLYLSQQHEQALAHLIYGIKEKKGITLLTGEVGTGKTTIINAMLEKLKQSVRIAHISNPNMVLEDLFTYIFDGFRIDAPVASKSKCLIKLRDFLLKQSRTGINSILIIDEAQNLSLEILEEIRLLSNLETKKEKLIQILLVGQPELNLKLSNPQLRQLRQRISAKFHITPLNLKETQEYISQRLLVAGANNTEIFNKKAINEIFFYTHGIPRLINIICDLSLVIGFAFQKTKIDERIIKEAIKSLADNHSPTVLDEPLSSDQTHQITEIIATSRNDRKRSLLRYVGIGVISCLVFGVTFFWAWDLSVMVRTLKREINQITPSGNNQEIKQELINDKDSMADKPDKIEDMELNTEEAISSLREENTREEDKGTDPLGFEDYIPKPEEESSSESLPANKVEEPIALPPKAIEMVPSNLEQDTTEDIIIPKKTLQVNAPEKKLAAKEKRIAVVKKGDTLTSLAIEVYGLASKEIFSFIRSANPDITDINHIIVGQRIIFPELPSELLLPYGSSFESFGVQVDAFWELGEANNKLLQLMDKGYHPLLIPVDVPSRGRLYRVILGIFRYEEEADRYVDSLKTQEGFNSVEVIPLLHYRPITTFQ
jgi:general secretion pathway protein A